MGIPLISNPGLIKACVDANVIISGAVFGGKPENVLQKILKRDFQHCSSEAILNECGRNLKGKLKVDAALVDALLSEITAVSTMVIPKGEVKAAPHAPDNLVLETALLGGCSVLVTGDTKHLIPLETFQGIAIETPAQFLARFPS